MLRMPHSTIPRIIMSCGHVVFANIIHIYKTYLPIDQCSQGKIVEEISEILPYIRVSVLAQTLIIEPINLGNLPALMISSQNGDSVRKSNLQWYKATHKWGPYFALYIIISTGLTENTACSCAALKQPQFSIVPCFRHLSLQ